MTLSRPLPPPSTRYFFFLFLHSQTQSITISPSILDVRASDARIIIFLCGLPRGFARNGEFPRDARRCVFCLSEDCFFLFIFIFFAASEVCDLVSRASGWHARLVSYTCFMATLDEPFSSYFSPPLPSLFSPPHARPFDVYYLFQRDNKKFGRRIFDEFHEER